MFGLFGKKKDDNKTKKKEQNKEAVIETISKLNKEINDIEEKIQHLEAKKNGQLAIAKEKLAKGEKTQAKQALQKKKWFDDQIKSLDGAMMMLEEQKMMLDGTMSMGSVYEALQQGSQAINLASENFKVEDLDKIRDEMEDNKMTFNEKNEFFKEYSVVDDPELDDELDQLASELDNEALPDVSKKVKEDIKVEVPKEDIKNKELQNLEDFLA
jgi:hypothetical protein